MMRIVAWNEMSTHKPLITRRNVPHCPRIVSFAVGDDVLRRGVGGRFLYSNLA